MRLLCCSLGVLGVYWCVLCVSCVSFLALVCDSIETPYIRCVMSSIRVFPCVLGFGVLIYCFFRVFFLWCFPFFFCFLVFLFFCCFSLFVLASHLIPLFLAYLSHSLIFSFFTSFHLFFFFHLFLACLCHFFLSCITFVYNNFFFVFFAPWW